MFIFAKYLYWRVVLNLHLIGLKIKYRIKHKPKIKFVHLPKIVACNIEENHKAYNTTQVGTSYAIIGICLENHSSLNDLLESLYHEYRHVMQHSLLDSGYIILWSALAKRKPYYYLASPIEIDARLFAKTRGQKSGMEVFEEFGVIDNSSFSLEYVDHCKRLADSYILEWDL